MVISLVSLKGGSGKTTLSTNLAVYYANQGESVVLIDADPNNQNSLKWSGVREPARPSITTVSLPEPAALRNNIGDIKATADKVIIDGTPALEKLTGTIMMVSDLVLLPIRSSTWDVWAFNDKFIPKYEDIKAIKPDLDCWMVRNAVQVRKKISREVLDFLEQYDLPLMKSTIGDRTVFEVAPMQGLGATECNDEQAAWEIKKLAKEVNQILTAKLTTV